jgi:uncharacterized protein (DUF433 family)
VKDVSGAVLTNETKKDVHRQLLVRMPDLAIAVGAVPQTDTREGVAWRIKRSGCYPVAPSTFVCLTVECTEEPNQTFNRNMRREPSEHQHGLAESEAPFYVVHGWGAFRSCLEAVEEKLKNPLRIGDNLLLDVFQSWKQIDDRLAKTIVAQHIVVTDPDIRGGEPVVRGTRIPAYLLHDLAEQGATEDELLADYPAIDKDRLGFVLLYTKTHPRPGRPRKQPWSSRVGVS